MKNNKKQRILVIAVHPDDETLGCGGTLLKHAANSDKIHWLIKTLLSSFIISSHASLNHKIKALAAVARGLWRGSSRGTSSKSNPDPHPNP